MTTTEIKEEINKEMNRVLDQVPEKVLVDILHLLKEVQSDVSEHLILVSNFKKILSEDSDLLLKLAQ